MAKDHDDYIGTCRSDVFGERVIEDLKHWKSELSKNGLLDVWQRNFRQYMNSSAEPTADGWQSEDAFSIQGENGEILGVRVNECRNLVTNALNLTYAKPIGLRAVATNATPEALQAADIGNTVLQERFKAASGGKLLRNCGEIGLVVTTGFLDCEWDLFAGEAYLPADDATQTYTGAPKMSERWPDEVRFDLTKRRWDDVWCTSVIQRANRYILASQIPDFADEILSQPPIHESELASLRYSDERSDDIVVVKYLHRPVNSRFLPSGRFGLVLENGVAIKDGDSPYSMVGDGRLGIFPITASSGMGSVYGYPIMNDLSPLQQWLNLVATMIATLIAGYGAPNIAGPIMQQLEVQQLVGGGRYFGMKGDGKVEALDLLPDMKPLFELLSTISSFGEKLSGMNSVVRGGAEQEMSGKAVALWKSMAVQFMSSFMQSAIEQAEGAGDYVLRLDQTFATGEQKAAMVGDDNVQRIEPYRASETFKYIAKVRCEAVDPVSMTAEGREERARYLLEQGAFTSPQEYITMVRTGRDEPLYKGPMAQNMLIQRENALLMQGKEPKILESDKHELHIQEHDPLLAEPSIRENDAFVGVVEEHKAKHKLFMMGITPMQGVDPMTGQPYPSAIEQFKQAEAEKAMQEQALAQQQSMTGAPVEGEQTMTEQPQQQAQPTQGEPPVSAVEAMQQAAMGPGPV
jgi:hypothetical protein